MEGPRACLADELPALLAAVNRVFRPSGGDMGRDYPLLFSAANLANLRVITEGRAIIAHAGLCLRRASLDSATEIDVGSLGAVFTRDDHRNRGLAQAVVGDGLARARAAGARLALVSGDGPLYRRLGFAPAPPAACWECPPPAMQAEIPQGMVAPDTPAHIPPELPPDREVIACGEGREDPAAEVEALTRLYQAEPVHFHRTPDDWRALLAARTLFAWPSRIWIVRWRRRPVAYLAVAQRARRRVLEFAGDRAAILAAAPQVAEELVTPWHDGETAALARARGWSDRPLGLSIGSLWLQAPGRALPLPWYGLNYV